MTDRRHVLQMGALAAVALVAAPACSDDADEPGAPPPVPDAQQAAEITLIAAYDSAITSAGPARAAEYQRIRDEHVAHLRALGWEATPAPPQSPAPPASLRALRRAEIGAGRSHAAAAVRETDQERAQLLALIAASESQHAAALGTL
ncbi:MAG: hypothetical protein KDC08_11335 [Actinobacteria bacterium]|nr:hypothetical protein [Actinomycetota bacterium]